MKNIFDSRLCQFILFTFVLKPFIVYLDSTFFFHINAFRGKLTPSFSKCCIEKERSRQPQVKFSSLLKNWVLCSVLFYVMFYLCFFNWPSNLVNNVSCKCSLLWHKVREIFLVLGEKKKKTVTLYWNLDTSEFPPLILLFVCFVSSRLSIGCS